MDGPTTWVPFRWPSEWQDPSALDLLKGTPLNCVVLSFGAADQPRLAAVVERARAEGLALVAITGADAGAAAIAAAARSAQFNAVLSDTEVQGGFPVIWWAPRSRLPWAAPGAVLAANDGLWPGIPMGRGGGAAEGGPTGMPWVDSNAWFVQLARTRAPGKTIWLGFDPPAKPDIVPPASYLLAASDSAACGARWIVSLDGTLRDALMKKEPKALETWKGLTRAQAFFEEHRAWSDYRPLGVLGVLSDFSGPNEDRSGEILNLLARRSLPFRLVEKSRAAAAPLESFKAIVYPDADPPSADLRTRLLAFVRGGGVLVAGPQWGAAEGAPAEGDPYRRYSIRTLDRGRLALAKEPLDDPYAVAGDAQLLLSHRNDVLRLWNASSMNAYYTAAPGGAKALLQVVNYAARPVGYPVTAGLAERYRSARVWTLDAPAPAALKIFPTENGVELHLPPIAVYAAIELEK